MNLHTSRILFQKHSSYKCQFCTKVHEPSRLVSQVVTGGTGCNQNIETKCKNKLKLIELKDFCFKSKEKLAKER